MTAEAIIRDPALVQRFASLGLVLILPIFVACSSGQSKTSSPKTPTSPSWAGTWTRIEGLAVPPEKRLRIVQKCNQTPEYWLIEQNGASVVLDLQEAKYEEGVEMDVQRVRVEQARGTIHKSFARLEGQFGTEIRGMAADPNTARGAKFPVTYELQWEPKTEHLSGTRNGSPVRFVRTDFQQPEFKKCQNIP